MKTILLLLFAFSTYAQDVECDIKSIPDYAKIFRDKTISCPKLSRSQWVYNHMARITLRIDGIYRNHLYEASYLAVQHENMYKSLNEARSTFNSDSEFYMLVKYLYATDFIISGVEQKVLKLNDGRVLKNEKLKEI